MADIVPVRFGLVGRKIRASLKEYTGAAANLSAGGTVVTLQLRLVTAPFTALSSRTATIDDANGGLVHYTTVSGDFHATTGELQIGRRFLMFWKAQPVPAGFDTGEYPDGDSDILEIRP